MTNRIYRDYTGDDITTINEAVYTPIINNVLYKNDLCVIVGRQKTNKSIMSMQMACNISSGTPFLKVFEVPEPGVVWYFGTEGKDNEIRNRFLRMSNIIPTNFDNIVLFCSTQLKFNAKGSHVYLAEILDKYKDKLPSVIFIDSLYSGYKGKLTEDDTYNNFVTVIRGLMEECNDASCVLAHHMTKEQRDKDGKIIQQTDSNAYGSTFLLGSVDHCFTIEKCRKEDDERIIKCTTQREGRIVEEMRVRFFEPDPLHLDLLSSHLEEEKKISNLLRTNGEMSSAELLKKSSIKKSLLYIVLGEMVERKKVTKDKGYGGKYSITGGDL